MQGPRYIAVAISQGRVSTLDPNNAMKTKTDFDYAIALDRSDAKLDVCVLIDEPDAELEFDCLENSPEALSQWFELTLGLYPGLRPAVIFEQPAAELIGFFSKFEEIPIYAINPKALARFRETFNTSRAKNDQLDSIMLAELLIAHSEKFRPYRPDSEPCRRLAALVEARRGEVQRRVEQTNRLKSLLKKSFPQALKLVGEQLWRPSVLEFLRRWPSLQTLRKAKRSDLVAFYKRYHCTRGQTMQKRLEILDGAVALTDDPAVMLVASLRIRSCLAHIGNCSEAIESYDQEIRRVFSEHPDAPLYESLPGAGEAIAPRLLAAMGESRDRFDSREALQRYSGVAPVTKQSGGKRHVHRRYCRPRFVMQTFVEYAMESVTQSGWANAFWLYKKDKGMRYNCAMRELAYKWQRIIFRMWQDRVPYDESKYVEALIRKKSPITQYL